MESPQQNQQILTPGINNFFFLLLVFVVLIFTFSILSNLKHEIADEGFHSPVIYAWYGGKFEKPDNLTVLPLYHATVAGLMHVLQLDTVKSIRFITLLLSVISLAAFYFICKRVNNKSSETRTLMYLLCPLILPFFSLIYTDIPALSLVLIAILFMLKGWHWPAAAVGFLAVFFRQPALVWIGFCGLYLLAQSWTESAEPWKDRVRSVLHKNLLNLLPYALVFVAFAVFVYFNKGLSAGDVHAQKIDFNPSNVYFYLLLSFFLFLPYNFEFSQRVYQILSKHYLPWICIAVFFFVYFFSYSNSHGYNSYGLDFHLRNILLHHTVTNFTLRILTFVAITWMALTLYIMARDSEKPWQLYVLYFSTLVCLVPLPLIEQRYYIPALALFMIWKPETHPVSDRLVLISYVPTSAAILYGIAQYNFFL